MYSRFLTVSIKENLINSFDVESSRAALLRGSSPLGTLSICVFGFETPLVVIAGPPWLGGQRLHCLNIKNNFSGIPVGWSKNLQLPCQPLPELAQLVEQDSVASPQAKD